MKTCTKCKESKPLSEFYRRTPHGALRADCKACVRAGAAKRHRDSREVSLARMREAYLRDREARLDYQKAYNGANTVNRRESRLLREYGMPLKEYTRMLSVQRGKCAICSRVTDKPLHVDHDHVTGEVRGLLCHNCNVGLGHFKDDPALLGRAIDYLKLTGEVHKNGME